MFMMVLPQYVVKWTTDDTANKTVAGLEHELHVSSDDLATVLKVITRNPFRSLSVEPKGMDQTTDDAVLNLGDRRG